MTRRNLIGIAAAATSLTLGGCAGTPPEEVVQEIDFVRGCWVEKADPDGPVTGFLRLLPLPTGDIGGVSQAVSEGAVKDRFRFVFAPDGSRLTITYPNGATGVLVARPKEAPPGGAAFGSAEAGLVLATGDENRLSIRPGLAAAADFGLAFFNGRRDGCD